MTDQAMDEGGAPGAGAGQREWVFPIAFGPPYASGNPPPGRKAVEALYLEAATYRVSYDETPSGPSAYRQKELRWVNRLFVIAATGEEVNRMTLGEGAFDTREEAARAFKELKEEFRTFILPRAANVIFIPIAGPKAFEDELRVRLSKIT